MSSESGDIKYPICYMISQDHVIERSRKFLSGSFLVVCHNLGKFSDQRFCESRDLMFLICHMTSHDHMLEGLLCDFKGGRPSQKVAIFPCLLVTV